MDIKWKSLTERVRKHKNEYLKAGAQEIAFSMAARKVTDKTMRNKKGASK